MFNAVSPSAIRLRGVRHNNLKNFDLDLPLGRLIVITGLSGSGKSSLAFDTLFAEGQRRYIETFSPYARQFFDRMDKPQVDSIEGIPPAIAIEQRNAVKTTRSTVGTMTEICDHMKLLWPQLAQLHCSQCGQPVRKDSPQSIWQTVSSSSKPRRIEDENEDEGPGGTSEVLITFDLPLSEKLSLEESLALIAKQGYQRLLSNGEAVRIDEAAEQMAKLKPSALTVVQDRVRLAAENRARFVEACEQAYHYGKGKLAVHRINRSRIANHQSPVTSHRSFPFSNRLHCATCDIEYREPSPALFSFNHPLGACPTCRGFGRIISIDYDLAIPDGSKTIAEGAVKPWQTGQGLECQQDLLKFCRIRGVPTDVPFEKLSRKWQTWVIEGDPDYGKDADHEWPRAWYGVKGYFRWLESKAYKMHVRVLLSRYRAYTPCPDCQGRRLQPEALLYRYALDTSGLAHLGRDQHVEANSSASTADGRSQITLAGFYALPIRDALQVIEAIAKTRYQRSSDPVGLVLNEVRSRLGYLNEVGLGYLTLDRPTRTLSGGETERVNLTTCLGTRLVNTLFVLDEPSVGLHPRDTERLVRILEQLRDADNTVVVVEHEASVMRAADQIVDLGPGHGATGGEVVFQGAFSELLKCESSLTGQYLSGRKQVEVPNRRPVRGGQASRPANLARRFSLTQRGLVLHDAPAPLSDRREAHPALILAHATKHNLKDLTVQIPLGRFVCLTGVSGSGKTTLVKEVLLPALEMRLRTERQLGPAAARIEGEDANEDEEEASSESNRRLAAITGWEHLGRVVLVDQSILGKTPRSNPAVYIGAFDHLRELFAEADAARQRGLNPSAFSFNSAQGQCERCRGAGFEKIEMQFLSDVFIRCPDCDGRRYRPHILEVKIRRPLSLVCGNKPGRVKTTDQAWSIADVLDATVDEVVGWLSAFAASRPARRALAGLHLLREVGLGYLRLGQPVNTLSGGESQRLKLVRHLAEAAVHGRETKVESKTVVNADNPRASTLDSRPTSFLFDEPTTGLHFDDIGVLLKVFQRLVEAGHSIIVIEHNLDVIKCADWVIDLGPDAGDQGGQVVAQGTPEHIAACPGSHTGKALREVLPLPAWAAAARSA